VDKIGVIFGFGIEFETDGMIPLWWQWLDLNQRPKAYESSALPLSYTAGFNLDIIAMIWANEKMRADGPPEFVLRGPSAR
jgi:hypothetical protein